MSPSSTWLLSVNRNYANVMQGGYVCDTSMSLTIIGHKFQQSELVKDYWNVSCLGFTVKYAQHSLENFTDIQFMLGEVGTWIAIW